MSLKAFHVFFVAVSVLCALGFGAWSAADPVSWLQWFGDTPSDPSFGDVPLTTELTEGHTDYYDPDRPTLAAIGQVVAGVRRGG